MATKNYLNYEGLTELVAKIKEYCNDIGHFVFKGTAATVAALPALASVKDGDVYSITTADTTTADFVEGADIDFAANTEVIKITGSNDDPKWCLLGSVFKIDDRLQFGIAMPSTGLTNGRTFLYIGDTTYTYTAVTPAGTENPQELGWYEESSGTYSLTTDTTVTSGKTYYTRAEQYVQGVIYQYDLTNTKWVALSSGDTFTPITVAQVDALFRIKT